MHHQGHQKGHQTTSEQAMMLCAISHGVMLPHDSSAWCEEAGLLQVVSQLLLAVQFAWQSSTCQSSQKR